MNEVTKSQWMLLGRPRWVPALTFLGCFGILFYYAGASFSSPAQVLIVAAGTILYMALFDVFRFLSRQPAVDRLSRPVFGAVGISLSILAGFLSDWICHALSCSAVLTHVIGFCFLGSIAGAVATRLVPSRQDKERSA